MQFYQETIITEIWFYVKVEKQKHLLYSSGRTM